MLQNGEQVGQRIFKMAKKAKTQQNGVRPQNAIHILILNLKRIHPVPHMYTFDNQNTSLGNAKYHRRDSNQYYWQKYGTYIQHPT